MQLPANCAFVELQAPADLNGGVTTGFFSMKNYNRANIFIHMGAVPSQAATLTVTLKEAVTVAGGSAQALDVPRCYKWDATTDIYTAVTVETDGTVDVEANSIYVIDVQESELTVNSNFDCLGVEFADPGVSSSYGAIYAILIGPKTLATALTN